MPIIRFRDNSRELSDFQTQMNQLFDNFLGQPTAASPMERVWAPLADVYETSEEMVISVEMPGFSEKDIRLSVTGDVIVIQAERPMPPDAQNASFHRRERWFGRVERAFQLTIPVETSKVVGTYRDGVLTVRLPKRSSRISSMSGRTSEGCSTPHARESSSSSLRMRIM